MKKILLATLMLTLVVCSSKSIPVQLDETVQAYLTTKRLAVSDSLLQAVKQSGVQADAVYDILQKGILYPPMTSGAQAVDLLNSDGRVRSLGILVPQNYDPTRAYPLMVWLHGGVNGVHPHKGTYAYRSFMRDSLTTDRFIISITGEKGATWFDAQGFDNINQGVQYIKQHYHIDDNRVVLAGISDGGTGGYFQGVLNAGPYAGFVCMSSYPAMMAKMKMPMYMHNMRHSSWFIIHTGKDRLYPQSIVKEYVKFFSYMQIPLAGKFYRDKGHDLGGFRDDALPAVYAWMDTLSRVVPDTINWSADRIEAGRLEWIQMEDLGPSPHDFNFAPTEPALKKFSISSPYSSRIRAIRTGNTVRIFSNNVRKFSLLIAPDQFDLQQKIEVYANGALVFNSKVSTDATWMLRDFKQYRDRTRIYTARLLINLME